MAPWTPEPSPHALRRLGSWSAWGMVAIGGAYAVALAAGFARYGLRAPITGPLLAVMEVLTLLSAPVLLVLFATVQAHAVPARRLYGTIALACATLFAGLTSAVHFVALTALRQLGTARLVWPSALYALELLAWDFFLGLALLFAAAVFPTTRPTSPSAAVERLDLARQDLAIRRGLQVAGLLCLAGLVGPAVGQMRVQLVGVLGYAGVLPVVCWLLARRFGRPRSC